LKKNLALALHPFMQVLLNEKFDLIMRPDMAKQFDMAKSLGGSKTYLPHESKITKDLVTAVLSLRLNALNRWLQELYFLAQDAREQGDPRAEAYERDISTYASQLAKIDRALVGQRRPAASPRLGVR
jgi:hypothetical protein